MLAEYRRLALPETVDEALAALADRPEARIMGGGTELMPDWSLGRFEPSGYVSLRHVRELRGVRRDGDTVVVGAMTRIADLVSAPVAELAPALAEAAESLGTPQVRRLGTIGGNVVSAQPFRNLLPALIALEAEIVLASTRGVRTVAYRGFTIGPGRTAREHDEVVVAIRVPVLDGFQGYVKVGGRNAQFVATASAALVLDRTGRSVRLGLGNAAPTPIRADRAEAFAAAAVDWDAPAVTAAAAEEFGRLAAAAAAPPDDFVASGEYRRHAVGVLARRLLTRAFPGGSDGR